MIEPVIYFGIGFLAAALLGLLFIPLVHNRAVRLTQRRLEAATPLSIAEIRADKDQLRAEFAMSTRRLEMSVAQMKKRTTTQLSELGKKTDAINQLKKELGEKTAMIFELETRDKTTREQWRASEQEFELKSNALREAERALADKEAELVRLVAELGEHSIVADSQRVELATLRTQVDAMKVSVTDYEHTVNETQQRLSRERDEAARATTNLSEARGRLESLGSRTGDLEQQLMAQTSEAESLSQHVQELETELVERRRAVADRDHEITGLRRALDDAHQMEADLRSELANTGSSAGSIVDKFHADISQLEAQLAAALDERAKLQRELATLKREAETSWEAERIENALLRERINDVAAEVARLTALLEGPDSPIDAMLALDEPDLDYAAGHATSAGNGTRADVGINSIRSPRENKSTLADRIRALQSTASRVASSN
jgi:chromosome segregation ATPase